MQNDMAIAGAVPLLSGMERICGSGETAELIRAQDWSATSLGPISEWPDALVVLVNMMLANGNPMIMFWGDELTQLYNDAAIPILGPDKHPQAIGLPARLCWAEVWHLQGPQLEDAWNGKSIWAEDVLVPIYRNARM